MPIQQPQTEKQEKVAALRASITWFGTMLDERELEVLEATAAKLAKNYSPRYQKWREKNNG